MNPPGTVSRQRLISRVATAGLATVLILLVGFAMWTTASTRDALDSVSAPLVKVDTYQRAQFALSTEALLQREAMVGGVAESGDRFLPSARSFVRSMRSISWFPAADDRATAHALLALHARYVVGYARLVAAVSHGNRVQAAQIDQSVLDPLMSSMQSRLNLAAQKESSEALHTLHVVNQSEATIRRRALAVFASGILFLAAFGVVMQMYRRRMRAAEAALQHLALHDPLTDLPNRMLLLDRLQRALLAARRDQTSAALLFLDLDRFKDVNDTWGHQYGDVLLQETAARLVAALRESDTVARLGGDEFAALLPGADREGAIQVAEKILECFAQPFLVKGTSFRVGGSVGIALAPEHAADVQALMQFADVAMYAAKRSHSGYAVYADHGITDLQAALAARRESRG